MYLRVLFPLFISGIVEGEICDKTNFIFEVPQAAGLCEMWRAIIAEGLGWIDAPAIFCLFCPPTLR